MKRVGVIPNVDKDIDLTVTKTIVSWLEAQGCSALVSEQVAPKLQCPCTATEIDEIYKLADWIVVLGGDGTFLGVARHAAMYNAPILGVNLGTLGFLAEVEKTGALLALEKLLQGSYHIEKRMMLEANVLTRSTIHNTFTALNDVVITRGAFSRIVDLHVYVNDQFVDVFPADGIIASTPTGSTAYNLSAGGPILHPSSEMIVITPICPHTLYSRSFVISGQDTIKICIGENRSYDISLTMDGQVGYGLRSGDEILIRKSKYSTNLIKTYDLNFYDILRKKIVGIRK